MATDKVKVPVPAIVKVPVVLLMALLTVMSPAPVNVKLSAVPLIAVAVLGLRVKVPAALPMVAAAFNVITPVILLAPLVLEIAPIEPTPAPVIPIVLAIVMPLDRAKVPPLLTVTAEAPKAVALLIAKVAPLLMVVVPL